jgi:hypothetical protein
MMDLGTAIGVVSLSLQVLEGVIGYYSAYQDYGDDIVALCTSSAALIQTLQLIHRQLQRKDSITSDIRDHILTNIYRCDEGLRRLRTKLDKIRAQPVSLGKNLLSGIQRQATNHLRKATYPFKCSTLAKLSQSVQDLRDNLTLGLEALELDTTEQNTRLLTSLDLRVDRVIEKL